MKEQINNPSEEKDNVLSLEKKLEAKKKEGESFAKQFEREFFKKNGEEMADVIPIKDGAVLRDKKNMEKGNASKLEIEKQKAELLAKKTEIGEQLQELYNAISDFEKKLINALEVEKSKDQKYIDSYYEAIKRTKEKIDNRAKAWEEADDQLEKIKKQEAERQRKEIYGE
ncbi:MAG: hypothetical protein Q8O83_05265 [bacterium]|nr:hypothetical protein [bacterium]